MITKRFSADSLSVVIAPDRAEMGRIAGNAVAERIKELLREKDEINMIFAAAPSQNEMLESLLTADVDFSKINAYHMDEYIGLPKDAPQSFGNYLRSHIFLRAAFKSISYIDGSNQPAAECARYSQLLRKHPIDIVCMGIGENGHIAFNDPGVADFHDKHSVKVVALDEICRMQQVNDGCFAKTDDVPHKAITLTIPMLVSADTIFCTVPAKTKANAVYATVTGTISEACPASILRAHKHAILFCDADSGTRLL